MGVRGWESGLPALLTWATFLWYDLSASFAAYQWLPFQQKRKIKKRRGQRGHTLAVSRSNCLASFSLAFCAAFASRSLAFIAAISCLVNPLYSSQSTRVSWCNSSFLYYGEKKRKKKRKKHAVSSLVFDRFCTPLSSPEEAVRFFDFSVGAKVVRGVGVLSSEST